MRKLLIPLLAASTWLFAGNTMAVHDGTVDAFDTVTVHLDIINDTPFVAFQVDIPLPSNLTYVDSSIALTSRSTDHTIGASVLGDTLLRIIAYSSNNSAFLGDSGDVATFTLAAGPVPGDFLLDLTDPIIGDSAGNNIISDTVNGTITVLGPDIDIQIQEINYDSTPLGSYNDATIYIHNTGNESLSVFLAASDSAFLLVDGDSIYIPPYGGEEVTIRFEPYEKGNYRDTLTISSSDPDESTILIPLNARCYTINELHVGYISAASGDTATLTLSINNQEPFVAFQCDIILPGPMNFIEGSESLSVRAVDHNISANLVGDSTLRVVAYSPTNTPFNGNDGEIAYLRFHIFGTGGYYYIDVGNVIIGDTTGENITSWYYGGSLHIYAPDISVPDTFNFGDVSLPDTVIKQVYIYNTGDDTLVVESLSVVSSDFWISGHIPTLIPPSSHDYVDVAFHSSTKGNRYASLVIHSNDPDERSTDIVLTANAYAPNYILAENGITAPGDTVTVKIDVDNYEPFVAFQFDLRFPERFNYIENSARLTDRAADHTLAVNLIEDGRLRAVAYSMTQAAFQGNSGPVLELDFAVSEGTPTQFYQLTIDNAILGDSNGTNILWDTQNGYITVDGVPPGTPSPIGPEGGSFLNFGTPQFVWSSVTDSIAGVAGYELEYADNPEFSSAVDTELTDTSFTPSEPLTDTTWYWRVRALDAAGNLSSWSEVRNFTIDTQAPATPTLLSPAGGEWLDTLTVSFSWSESSSPLRKAENRPKASPVYYVFELTRTGEPYLTDTLATSSTSYTIDENIYTWRVKAFDLAGNESDWSYTSNFGIDRTPPSQVTLISPLNNSYINQNHVTFSFHHSSDNLSGIHSYLLLISPDSLFSSCDTQTTHDTTITISGLPQGTIFWQVLAIDSASNISTPSPTWNFEIDTSPPISPSPLFPPQNAFLNANSTTLIWSSCILSYHNHNLLDPNKSPVLYILQLDTLPDFNNPIISDTVEDTSLTVNDLTENIYTWRVKAFDLAGNESDWSYTSNFGIDQTPPIILEFTEWSDTTAYDSLPVTAHVEDDGAGTDSVLLHYSFDGATWNTKIMQQTADSFTAYLPCPDTNASVLYFLTACDRALPPNWAESDTISFSITDIAERSGPDVFSMKLVQNPVKKALSLEFQMPRRSPVSVRLMDPAGRCAFHREFDLRKGRTAVSIDLDGLPSGLYILEISTKGIKTKKTKILKF